MKRFDNRTPEQLRPVKGTLDFIRHAEGSILIEFGHTKVICTASVEERGPSFLAGKGQGWVTAEYGMLPRSTHQRILRPASRGKQNGRTMEIQRLIGRSLRPAVDLVALGERTIFLDCDVIQADGGTRTAAVTGAFIALYQALGKLRENKVIKRMPINFWVAAVSVGIVGRELLLDLCYEEDSQAEVDLNLVMTDKGKIIEIQGTAEGTPFSHNKLNQLIALGQIGCEQLIRFQKKILKCA